MSAAVLLHQPKFARNVGAALRAVSCYGGDGLWFTGDRIGLTGLRRLPREERMRAFADTPWHQLLHDDEHRPVSAVARATGRAYTPVAVELLPSSERLHDFEHPDDALYVFGPEDDTLPAGVRAACHRFVVIPSLHCLNLSAAVYTVLYDRMAKRVAAGLDELPTVAAEQRGWWHDPALEGE